MARLSGAPGPVACLRTEASADGVFEDVAAGGREVIVVRYDPRVKAIAEEVPTAGVAAVEPLSVEPIQAVKASRQSVNGRFPAS